MATNNKPRAAFDFEFRNTRQKDITVVAVAVQIEGEQPRKYWLMDETERTRFVNLMKANKDLTWLAYGATAEAECMISLGLNPRDFVLRDLYADVRQIKNGSPTWNNGHGIFQRNSIINTCCRDTPCECAKKTSVKIKNFVKLTSVPIDVYEDREVTEDTYEIHWRRLPRTDLNVPYALYNTSFGTSMQERDKLRERAVGTLKGIIGSRGWTSEPIPNNLVNAQYSFTGTERSGEDKNELRDIILTAPLPFTDEQRFKILEYAEEDVIDLFKIDDELHRVIKKQTGWDDEKVTKARTNRGRFAANTAHMVRRGLPISKERLNNLRTNKVRLMGEFFTEFNKDYFPIYTYFKDTWHRRNREFDAFIGHLKSIGHVDKWSTNKNGSFSTSVADGSDVQKYAVGEQTKYTPISRYKAIDRVTNAVGSIPVLNGTTLSESGVEDGVDSTTTLLSFLGDDYRLRPYFGIYGTQTGRNAPKATGFLPAQSSWLRALIEPPKGRCVVEIDVSSQEFFIAAALSKDEGLHRAYNKESFTRGDPYLAFAYEAGILTDKEVEMFLNNKATDGEGLTGDDLEMFNHSKDLRKLSKSTVLGLSYGLGVKNLANKLRSDSKDWTIPDSKAKELVDLHKQAYPTYYAYKEQIADDYFNERKPIIMPDGWYLAAGKPSAQRLSVLNVPFQGSGASWMHSCVDMLMGANIEVICPVHDAIIFECDIEDLDETNATVARLMIEASDKMFGEGVRVGAPEVVKHGGVWVTEKGYYDYEKYGWALNEIKNDKPFVPTDEDATEIPLPILPKTALKSVIV